MSESATSKAKKRPEFYNIGGSDLISYRWPLASIVSGMHRVSGAIMFFLMPFVIWMFDNSISSEISFDKFTSAFNVGMLVYRFHLEAVALGLIWLICTTSLPAFATCGWIPITKPLPRNSANRQRLRDGCHPGSDGHSWRQTFRPLLNLWFGPSAPPQTTRKLIMSVNFGPHRLVVGAHYGMRDWLSHGVTAVLMALFTVLFWPSLYLPGPHRLCPMGRHFSPQWMKL